MLDITLATAPIALALLAGAWREHRHDNGRDSGLLAAFGLAGAVASAAAWFA